MIEDIQSPIDIHDELDISTSEVQQLFNQLLPKAEGPESRVIDAVRYAIAGAHGLRSFLAIQSGHLFDVDKLPLLRIGAAVECAHASFLVREDLPSLGNRDKRRGRPTIHVAFDEPTAILTADALQAIAFEILVDEETHPDPHIRCELVERMAKTVGGDGLVGGQMISLQAQQIKPHIGTITRLQRLKTGSLISFACLSGAIVGRASPESCRALETFAHDLGLAMQVIEDLAEVDKAQGGAAKATFVSLLGPERAQDQAQLLAEQAKVHLEPFDQKASLLREVCNFVLTGQQ